MSRRRMNCLESRTLNACRSFERLEERMVLAVAPLGPEFLVNTVEVGSQTVAQKPSSVAMDDNGNFVVAWQSTNQIYAQRYNKAGAKQGGEIDVSNQSFNLSDAVVAMDSVGNFTVAWTSSSDDSSGQNLTGTGVFARSFSSAGTSYQSVYRVNETTGGNQSSATVAMDEDGNVVFGFQSSGGAGDSGTDIYVRSFRVATILPTVVMTQRRVNTSVTLGEQTNPSIATDELGNFVVAWVGTDVSGTGIRTKIYTATGSAITGEVIANTYTTGNQAQPVVALSPGADLSSPLAARFHIAWSGSGTGDNTDGGIYFRRMGVGADPSEIRANVFTTGFQIQPTIAVDYLGGVAVAWTSQFQDGSNFGVYARYFQNLPSGQLQGDAADRRVNSFTTGVQYLPSIAMDNDGDFVVAYAGEGVLDPNPLGVYARRYSSFVDDDAPTVLNVSLVSTISIPSGPLDVSVFGNEVTEGERVISSYTQIRVRFSEHLLSPSIDFGLYRDGQLVDGAFDASVGPQFINETSSWEFWLDVDPTKVLVPGNYALRIDAGADVTGNALDGDANGTPGGSFVRNFIYAPPVPIGGIVDVDPSEPFYGSGVTITREGTTIATWAQAVNNSLADTIYFQMFDVKGQPVTSQIKANTLDEFTRYPSAVAGDSGQFLLLWTIGASNSSYAHRARLFDSLGNPLTLEFDPASVNVATFGAAGAEVAMTPSGDFVMAWTGFGRNQPNSQDGSGTSIMARRFSANGAPLGPEFVVNTNTTGDQTQPDIAVDADGGFVIVWEHVTSSSGSPTKGVYAQRFDSSGTPRGSEFRVSTITTRDQEAPQVATDARGHFVVIWQDDVGNFVGDNVLLARRYNAAGIPLGAASFEVSPPSAEGYFYDEHLAMDGDGDFMISYIGSVELSPGDYVTGIGAVFFDSSGVFQRTLVMSTTLADINNSEPKIAVTAEGDGVVIWRTAPSISDGVSFARFAGNRDFVWYGTPGRDIVTFLELPNGDVQVTESMLNGIPVSNISIVTNVTGYVIAHALDGNDNIMGRQLATKPLRVFGDGGDDLILGGSANDEIYGGRGNDTIAGGIGFDTIDGGDQDDLVFGDVRLLDVGTGPLGIFGQDTILGGAGNDTIYGDSDGGEGDADYIDAGVGDDLIYADGPEGSSIGNDTIFGGADNDVIFADGDGAQYSGSAEGGKDSINGGSGSDFIDTGGGNDTADGGTGDDILLGGDGAEGRNDSLIGGDGRDILIGDFGYIDNLDRKAGADTLIGGLGEDIILAGAFLPESGSTLLAIQSEWVSVRLFSQRIANISGTGIGPRNNGDSFLLVGSNVFNDKLAPAEAPLIDIVLGGVEADWIFSDVPEDSEGDLLANDFLINLSPYPLPSQ